MTNASDINFDSPWKDAIETYFPDFIAFFFPHIYPDIDWSRERHFLDQELQQVVRDAELGKRLADKLVQVWRVNGEETWVLAHIEVQSSEQSNFAQRMHVYNYRLSDRYNIPIASLAVLGDERTSWRPNHYQTELW
ncbi:MAG: cytosolic protein, partial [Phormidesmis sp. CAN_BIN36]|nr:cytosolic protein [Phormidesmis sp. CAN_BIN36]